MTIELKMSIMMMKLTITTEEIACWNYYDIHECYKKTFMLQEIRNTMSSTLTMTNYEGGFQYYFQNIFMT